MPQDVQNTSSALEQQNNRNPAARQDQRREQQQPYMIPPVDVFETDAGITLLADLPGATRDRLNVRVDGDSLLIEASSGNPGPENMQLVYGEAEYGAYRRQFTLSRELDASRIEAQLKDGVLQLTIPKAEEARPRRIEVNVG